MLVLSLLLVACDGATDESEGTLDLRVDQNGDKAVESTLPRTCLAGGRLFTVWEDDRLGMPGIFLNLTADGKGFMPADVQINHGEAAATAPSIACDGDRIYVAWQDVRDGDYKYHNIYLNFSDDGGATWQQDDILLDGDPEGDHTSLAPQVFAVGSAAYVAWFDNTNGAYDIFVQASTDGGKHWLSSPVRADTDDAGSAYSAYPQIVANADGQVVVVWEDSRDGNNDVYANASNDYGASFSAADARLDGGDDPGAANSFSPRLAMAGSKAYVVWEDERYGDLHDVLLNASTDGGGSWAGDAVRVEGDAEGIADSVKPAVAATEAGVHVAWQDDRSGGYDIFHRFSTDGGVTWTTDDQRLDTDEPGIAQSYDTTVIVDGDRVVVGWRDGRSDAEGAGVNDLFYNYSGDAGATWAEADIRINSTAPGLTYATDLSMHLVDGNVYSVWADGRHDTTDIFFANRKLGESSVYVAPDDSGS